MDSKEVACTRCGRRWQIRKVGAEDWVGLAAMAVPKWFRDKTGDERQEIMSALARAPKQEQWVEILESQDRMKQTVDVLEKYAKPTDSEFVRSEVALCCADKIAAEIVEYTAEEAGLAANFRKRADGDSTGPDGGEIREKTE